MQFLLEQILLDARSIVANIISTIPFLLIENKSGEAATSPELIKGFNYS